MSVYPSCMQRPAGLSGVGLPALTLPWSSFSPFSVPHPSPQGAFTLQVQIPSFPRPVVSSHQPPKEPSSEQRQQQQNGSCTSPADKSKASPTAKSSPTSFTIASILSKTDRPSSAAARNSPILSAAINAACHASTIPAASPSTPLSGTPKTPLYYIYHPAAAQPPPFSFPAAVAAAHGDHDLQRSPLGRLAPPLTLGDCMIRRFGESPSLLAHLEMLQAVSP